MLSRLMMLGLLLGTEALCLSVMFDGGQLLAKGGLLAELGRYGPWVLRWALGASAIYSGVLYLKGQWDRDLTVGAWLRPGWLVLHGLLLAAFYCLTSHLYSGQDAADLLVLVWLLVAVALLSSGALVVLPAQTWLGLLESTRKWLWISATASALACALGLWARLLWTPVTAATFTIVKALLGGVRPDLVADPARMLLRTPRFGVIVSQECSGLEGMGLFLIFGLLWLFLFREELRFPQALLMVPAGILTLYLLNALRIAALLLIGDAGWKQIALKGFHSQAGWIAFNLVAISLLLGARRIAWIRKEVAPTQAAEAYPAAPYLLPFLAILAAGMLSGAATAQFEWLYPLRVFAGLGALWLYRKAYSRVDWRFGWEGLLAGLVVFLLWIVADALMGGGQTASGMPPELAAAGWASRWGWLIARVLGAVLVVPLAEELAFRGFGMRRLIAEDFEAVPWRSYTALSLGVSSLVFGLLHGGLWVAGILAGLVYGLLMVRRGRLGESVAAHATTNGLLAVYVLWSGRWYLW